MASHFTILAWHGNNLVNNEYAGNDLLAFESDLRTVDRLGFTIWPLRRALAALDAGGLPERIVVLTADDGPVMDFEDFNYPDCGPQKSLDRILREFEAERDAVGKSHDLHLSSFVIASPEARAELDRKVCHAAGVLSEHWWSAAEAGGRISIENHSWDHNHPALERTCQRDNRTGDFTLIDTEDECRNEIDRASAYIARRTGRNPRYLAYPFGQASDYLRTQYLPQHAARLGLEAALSCEAEPVTATSDRWFLPRFVCGRDWKSPAELEALLRDI